MKSTSFVCLALAVGLVSGCFVYERPSAETAFAPGPAAPTVSVAFPAENMQLPFLRRCRILGATSLEVTNVTVNGRSVRVHSGGAWATMIDVRAGTNFVEVSDGGLPQRRGFIVASPTSEPSGRGATARTYPKLPYAAEAPRRSAGAAARRLVALDPGHGGSGDCGAFSPHGRPEKEANLLLATALDAELRTRGYEVMMTRVDDIGIPLLERPRSAHERKADAFISLHHNAPAADGDACSCRYQAVYAWNDLGARLAAAIARHQGARVERANFAVIRSPEVPSVLIEEDFITHPEGEADSWDAVKVRARAAVIADGVDEYFGRREREREK